MSTANPVPPARRALGRGANAALPAQASHEDETNTATAHGDGTPGGGDATEAAVAEAYAAAPAAAAAAVEVAASAPEAASGSVTESEREAAPEADGETKADGETEAGAETEAESEGADAADVGGDASAEAVPSGEVAEAAEASEPSEHKGFAVRLDNFEGPFDLLLGLIAKHKLDVTEVSLSKVTDEFISYIRAQGPEWDLGVATEFLVVAATLLDLKAARLLPSAEVEDEEDLALLEARDLLFARLLQYRAYKEIASIFEDRWAKESRRYPRDVPLEERYTGMLPELVIKMDLDKFARIAARAMTPKGPKIVSIEHIHVQRVSVREQSEIVVERLRRHGALTFRALTADCPDNLHVIARFLCLLELFREAAVGFDQVEALGELHVRWTGGETDAPVVGAEFDEQDGEDAVPEEEQDADEAAADVEEAV
jgi:segregation and condensation protein A